MDTEEAKRFAEKLNIPFLEASAKQNTNVEEAFITMATDVKNTQYKTLPTRNLLPNDKINLRSQQPASSSSTDSRCCF